MTIAEIIKLEGERQDPSQWNLIHLVKEGDFYRAHDWSAWLMSAFPIGEAIEKPLKVIAKKLKDGYIDAFLGFPASSIGKYIPNNGSVDFRPVSDTQIDVAIEIPAEIGEVSFDNLSRMKEDWITSLPLIEGKKQKREDREVQEQAPRIVRFSDILSRIVSLPIEDMSPKDAWETLRDLRRQVSAMF
jgi:hypothetical protein